MRGLAMVLGGVVIACGLFGLHRLAVWMEQRGWIYYRSHPGGGNGGAARCLGALQEIIEPQAEYRTVAQDERVLDPCLGSGGYAPRRAEDRISAAGSEQQQAEEGPGSAIRAS